MNTAEIYLYGAVYDAISPIAELVESGDTEIEMYEPDVVFELTEAYLEALDMEIAADTGQLSSEAHMDTIMPAVEVAFMELSCQKEMGISPDETIDMLADTLLSRLHDDIESCQSQATA